MATEARARFFSFKWGSFENTVELQHHFGAAYAELEIQGVPETRETQAPVLMTYPTKRWRSFVDTISMRMPPPTVADIVVGMKIIEERQNVRDESEHGEANYAGDSEAEIVQQEEADNSSNSRQLGKQRKIKRWQLRFVTSVGDKAITPRSATSGLQPSARIARSSDTCSEPVSGDKVEVELEEVELEVREVLEV